MRFPKIQRRPKFFCYLKHNSLEEFRKHVRELCKAGCSPHNPSYFPDGYIILVLVNRANRIFGYPNDYPELISNEVLNGESLVCKNVREMIKYI